MPKRRANDDDESWSDLHAGDCALGSIHELRETNTVGKPYEPKRGPLGFDIRPEAYRGSKRQRTRRAKRVVG